MMFWQWLPPTPCPWPANRGAIFEPEARVALCYPLAVLPDTVQVRVHVAERAPARFGGFKGRLFPGHDGKNRMTALVSAFLVSPISCGILKSSGDPQQRIPGLNARGCGCHLPVFRRPRGEICTAHVGYRRTCHEAPCETAWQLRQRVSLLQMDRHPGRDACDGQSLVAAC
jgi:hypothetical protein